MNKKSLTLSAKTLPLNKFKHQTKSFNLKLVFCVCFSLLNTTVKFNFPQVIFLPILYPY